MNVALSVVVQDYYFHHLLVHRSILALECPVIDLQTGPPAELFRLEGEIYLLESHGFHLVVCNSVASFFK